MQMEQVMGEINGIPWMISCVVVCVGMLIFAVGALWYRHREKRTLKRIEAMLEAAINGTFTENAFDESLLSAVEAKFAKYLSASIVSAKNVAKEKEEIKALISDLSHQTKTPLTNLLLYTELLEEQKLTTEGCAHVKMLQSQGKRLAFLVESFVKASRLETGVFQFHRKENEVGILFENTVQHFKKRAEEKNISLCVETAEVPVTAVFDMKWTEEALGNLLDNAIKYTPAGGSVTLRAVPYEMFCRIDVEDTGRGIPEEERTKVFGRFYRSEAVAEEEGIGIGLYLVRQIVTGQGGYVKISEGKNGGTVFSLFIPGN